MAFDEALAARLRGALASRSDVVEKRMFGGIAFMVDGKMSVGILGEELMVRVAPDEHQSVLALAHVRPMDFTGRPMRGFVFVAPRGIVAQADLEAWIARSLRYIDSIDLRPRRERRARAPHSADHTAPPPRTGPPDKTPMGKRRLRGRRSDAR